MTSLSERLLAALDARDAELDEMLALWGTDPDTPSVYVRERRWVTLGRAVAQFHVEAYSDTYRRCMCGRGFKPGYCMSLEFAALAAALSVPLDPQETG